MRRLLYILIMVTTLAGVFGSCRHTPGEAEARLIAIDSLIAIEPDSALAQLEAINADALPTDLRAYHDLLVTQAMYKAYVPASTDTLITRAWRYYADHGPYDRRIRAMLYRGTVAEELGHPDSAMRWYKRTELESNGKNSYFHGLALMNIAYLYQFQYVAPKNAISNFRRALDDFRSVSDFHYQMVCLTQLGMIYRMENTDSARCYAFSALKMSKLLDDTINYYRNIESIAGSYYKDNDWTHTLRYALKGINSSLPNTRIPCYCFATQSYLYLGEVDSARALIAECPPPASTRDSVLFFRTISTLDSVENNYRQSAKYSEMAGRTASAAINRQLQYNYEIEEQQPAYENIKQSNRKLSLQVFIQYILTFLLFIFLIILSTNLYMAHRRIKTEKKVYVRIQEELRLLQLQTEELARNKPQKTDQYTESSSTLTELQAYCIGEVFRSVVYSGIRGTSIFKIIFSMEAAKNTNLISIKLPNDFWEKVGQYIDTKYPHAFDNMASKGISISDREKQIISLDCLNIPNAVIEKTLGYGERSLAPIRSKLLMRIGDGVTDINELLRRYSSGNIEGTFNKVNNL